MKLLNVPFFRDSICSIFYKIRVVKLRARRGPFDAVFSLRSKANRRMLKEMAAVEVADIGRFPWRGRGVEPPHWDLLCGVRAGAASNISQAFCSGGIGCRQTRLSLICNFGCGAGLQSAQWISHDHLRPSNARRQHEAAVGARCCRGGVSRGSCPQAKLTFKNNDLGQDCELRRDFGKYGSFWACARGERPLTISA